MTNEIRQVALFAAISLLLVSPALGWSEAGHKIIASIAFRQLTAAEQRAVVDILRQHPRFADDFSGKMPDEIKFGPVAAQHEWLFQQAAVWPDLIRDFQGPLKDRYHRGTWHYINRLHFLSDADRATLEKTIEINQSLDAPKTAEATMNVVQTIRLARQILVDQQSSADERAVMLCWLFHNVGDLHQPCHSTALYSQRLFPKGDRGGNSIPTTQRNNLHALWDQLPGNFMSFKEARDDAIAVVNTVETKALGRRAMKSLDEETWLDESHALAVSTVYAAEIMTPLRHLERAGTAVEAVPPITLSKDYLKTGGDASKLRLVEAGYRLGAVLNEAVAKK